ncbi:MAG: NAD(P)-binding domain-containing protein, partial [Rhodospirillaceae bacterium]|nr:NAD(P)-binding domain-containing protein [Rhodospirillaceae bacterium]
MFERIALIGIGLINSSIARFVRQDGLAHEIIIYSRRQTTLDKAMALGLADRAETDPAAAVEGADLV